MKLEKLHRDFFYEYMPSIDSTNSRLLGQSAAVHLLLAGTQTAGRGRRGNQWQDTAGQGLLFSLAFDFAKGLDLSAWPIAVATSLAKTLSKYSQQDIKIKWPNDLYAVNGAEAGKFAGILVETQIGQYNKVVTGVGLNLEPLEVIADYPIAYYQSNLSKAELLTELANQLYQEWQIFKILQTANELLYRNYDLLLDNKIIATDNTNQQVTQGIAKGINEKGQLNILDGNTMRIITNQQSIRIVE